MKFDTYVFFPKSVENFNFYIKTCVDLWQYLAEFCLEWEMFYTKVVQKIKTHILCSVTSFTWKSCRLWDDVEKRGGAREATEDNIIRRMPFACWITKVIDTHSTCGILFAFPRQQWLHSASQCYVIRALPVFCVLCWCCLAIMLWKAKVYLKTLLARDNALHLCQWLNKCAMRQWAGTNTVCETDVTQSRWLKTQHTRQTESWYKPIYIYHCLSCFGSVGTANNISWSY